MGWGRTAVINEEVREGFHESALMSWECCTVPQFPHLYMGLFLYFFVCVRARALCIRTRRVGVEGLPQSLAILSFEAGSFNELKRTNWLDQLSSRPRVSSGLHLSNAGIADSVSHLAFYLAAGDLNPGPHGFLSHPFTHRAIFPALAWGLWYRLAHRVAGGQSQLMDTSSADLAWHRANTVIIVRASQVESYLSCLREVPAWAPDCRGLAAFISSGVGMALLLASPASH